MNKKIIVGHTGAAYPDQRCIIDKVRPDRCDYRLINRKKNDLVYLGRKVLHKLSGRPISWDLESAFRPMKHLAVDVLHTFNTVCCTRQPWCSTFETTLPRTDLTCSGKWAQSDHPVLLRDIDRRLYAELAQDNCRALLALSRSAYAIQQRSLEALNVSAREQIMAKTSVLLPPQRLLVDDCSAAEKFGTVGDCLEILFVGRQFFRKGGAQVVDVLKTFAKKAKFHLTVVSALQHGDYVSMTGKADLERYRQLLGTTDWITWHPQLPNEAVLDLCRKAHVGLLPTFADTFGYSVLEMQAAACPVVTTDIRAMPEINDAQSGWICHLPKNSIGGEALYRDEVQRKILKETLKAELHLIFEQIFSDTGCLQAKGRKALQRIKTFHDPDPYGEALYRIYRQGLK